jgi:hypothetical protein
MLLDKSWTTFARALGRRGELSADDVRTVEILDLYGALIGNTDKHHGNIAVAWSFDRRHRLLEAYDMLPMRYRPNAHGEIVDRPWKPDLAAGLELARLPRCYALASQFWTDVLHHKLISKSFKTSIAAIHLELLMKFYGG